ncbi:MAG: matrixin family metalloprotease [Bdellovibrionales bacterium]
MKRQLTLSVLLFISFSALSIGCTKKESSSGPGTPETVIFVSGNPKDIVAHDVFNKKTLFNEKNISQFSDFHFKSRTTFISETSIVGPQKSAKELVNERRSSRKVELVNYDLYKWKPYGKDMYGFVPANASSENVNRYRFYFSKDTEGNLSLVSYNSESFDDDPKKAFSVETLHYSLHSSGKNFSLLVYEEAGEDQLLSAFYFQKSHSEKHEFREELMPFELLYGEKLSIRWPLQQPIRLLVCNITHHDTRQGIEKGLNVWKEELRGKIDLQYEHTSSCPPFSDLNARTLKTTANYKMKDVGAYATPLAGTPSQGLIDGDVNILLNVDNVAAKINASNFDLYQKQVAIITAHEMGHFWGLAHQPDKESIMNYEWPYLDRTSELLTDYDKEAIRVLYEVPEKQKAF